MNKKTGRKLKAFTLLELTVVIAIIVVLVAIAVPATQAMIRDSKTSSANDAAQQVYMAAQDYLVSLQINGKDATEFFGTADPTSGEASIGCVNGVSQTAKQNSGGKNSKIIHFSEDGTAHSEIKNGGTDNEKKATAVNEILSRLSPDFQGAWAVVVYPGTYTVKCAYYCGAKGDDHGFNWTGVSDVMASPYKNSAEQDVEVNKPSSNKKEVGQYPFLPTT